MFLSIAICGATLAAGAAAGTKLNAYVTITKNSTNNTTMAYGSMGSARASTDHLQEIGCWVDASSTGASMACAARDASGTLVVCSSLDPAFVTAVGAIASDSQIAFTADANGTCVSVEIRTQSFNLPKTP